MAAKRWSAGLGDGFEEVLLSELLEVHLDVRVRVVGAREGLGAAVDLALVGSLVGVLAHLREVSERRTAART